MAGGEGKRNITAQLCRLLRKVRVIHGKSVQGTFYNFEQRHLSGRLGLRSH